MSRFYEGSRVLQIDDVFPDDIIQVEQGGLLAQGQAAPLADHEPTDRDAASSEPTRRSRNRRRRNDATVG
ncbi:MULTISPECIES: hypothetical protein [unclassified Mesorhizobium]|uniref:hypothetical protein n=1 Tax=unclassified Mesorhizobium TaxID=325217 RepID=UPI000FD60E18|nr:MULTISPECIES: hypothetical protein [unclassified Mesorhizobium]RVB73773.1 hypothetical protein EN885_25225 [Mesorhizobium sp. M6A.T.Cr.TU.014.01.1.1]RWP81450.1 MAG: hypothetical protein EOR10_05395 [Mesorhizobium sp.]RWQ02589.1 MAG: hypothetical protein EOR91_21010 [Mesorhizobium sp.]RWQ06351.1 MAG: hypothetical protein EOR90_12955 [Mesorhizobium sp.]